MKALIFLLALALSSLGFAAEPSAVERRVAEAVQSEKITVVHFWAPWCPNCKAELANNGWSSFIEKNRDVEFIFVTIWHRNEGDGRAVLERYGLGAQKNFQLLLHPNPSTRREDKMTEFLGLPVTWIPTTWVFREGKLRYALNYGELRFPMLQQMVEDTRARW